MREKRWYVRLSEKEERMLKEVVKKQGFEKPSEWFRYILRREYLKVKGGEDEEGVERK